MRKIKVGRWGEELACGYLVEKGYRVIERNFKKPWGELDIIVQAPDKTLVFVEVKTLRRGGGLRPEEQMTSAKLRKFKRAAALYAGHRQDLISDSKGWRLDLVTVVLEDRPVFKHYENIV